MKVVFFLLFLIFTFVKAEEVILENLYVKNLPDSYRKVFYNFFSKNLIPKKKNISLDINVIWLSYSYNICILIKKDKIPKEYLCFTSINAERILKGLKETIMKNDFLALKKTKQKSLNLIIMLKGNLIEKKARLISSKGDFLTSYKEVFYSDNQQGDFIGNAIASTDLIILNDFYSAYILNKLLNNYKIDKIYIKN